MFLVTFVILNNIINLLLIQPTQMPFFIRVLTGRERITAVGKYCKLHFSEFLAVCNSAFFRLFIYFFIAFFEKRFIFRAFSTLSAAALSGKAL